jgi:hypothetical protein
VYLITLNKCYCIVLCCIILKYLGITAGCLLHSTLQNLKCACTQCMSINNRWHLLIKDMWVTLKVNGTRCSILWIGKKSNMYSTKILTSVLNTISRKCIFTSYFYYFSIDITVCVWKYYQCIKTKLTFHVVDVQ